MADGQELRERRDALDAAEVEDHGLRHALGRARELLDLAERRGDRALAGRAEKTIAALEERRASVVGALTTHRATIDRLREALLPDDPAELRPLPGSMPIALLPVRLETHFERDGQAVTELRIRVYPDDIHIDSHEPELTEEEVETGRVFWGKIWRAGADRDRRIAAWQGLAEDTGLERAEWVARETAPRNEPPDLEEPLDPTDPLPTEPDFPEPPRKGGDWTRAPRAWTLPDHWIALGFRGGERIFTRAGARIPDQLPVGPDPTAERNEGNDLFVDEASRWTIDFDRAEEAGMGIRVRAGPSVSLTEGLDLLLVIGVKASAERDEGAEALTRMFEAHRFGEGVAFLRRGTPTNNTEPERSGWRDVVLPDSLSVAPEGGVFQPGGASNAGRWAAALGLETVQAMRAFGAAEGATDNDRDAAAMTAALWPATWGYLLEQLAGHEVRPHVPALRRHVSRWVRAGGHHASLRLGNQPYGLVVQTDLDRLQLTAEDETERRLLDVLIRLRDRFWIPATARSPRAGRTGDPERDLVEILGQRAASPTYAFRPTIGLEFFANLWTWLGSTPYTGWRAEHRTVARAALGTLGFDFEAPIFELTGFSPFSEEIPELVQEGEVRPGQTLDPNYIQWILDSGYARIRSEDFAAPPPATLLYMLLRQAALQETAREAVTWVVEQAPTVATMNLEPELVDVRSPVTETATPAAGERSDLTLSRVLDRSVAGVTEGEPIGAFLSARRFSTAGRFTQFREFWEALEVLKDVPVERLELLLRETLDLSTHRLDAWLSSYAARLLADRRAVNGGATGVYVGGYGWVEDLRPRAAPRSDGYVHAPSNEHAGLAAVLRSAYLSHRSSDAEGAFAVDLSSERVRLASWILDGVRAGQPLGALLGYRFERALHEGHPGVELDAFIFALRRRAPLVAGKLEPTTEPFEAVAARNVVDGLALVRRFERNELSFDDADLPNPGTREHAAIIAELRALQAVIDAVGDALLAESVFQSGNPSRAGATLDAVASGEIPPPELEFARTPRRGLGVVHRVAVALPADLAPAVGWTPDARQVRAVADPALDAWLGGVLGAPDRYRYVVRYESAADGTLLHEEIRSLAALAISPLDAVFLTDADDPEGTELAERARHEVDLNRPAGVPADARVLVDLDVAEDNVTIRDLLEVSRAARRVLQRVRPLGGVELAALGEPSVSGIDLGELETRADLLVTRFEQLETRLAAALADALADEASVALDPLRDTLLGLHAFGVRGTLPRTAAGAGDAEREALIGQARAAAPEVQSRRRALDGELEEFGAVAPNDAQRALHARERIRAVNGGELPVLPTFTAPNGAELALSLAEQDALTAVDREAPVTWLLRNARVSDQLADLNDLLLYDGALNGRDPYALRVAQLPFRAGATWAALPGRPDLEEDANRLSLLFLVPEDLDAAAPMQGFVVDEWPETSPSDVETTAVTFHYDQPGARAANALLLAIAPDAAQPWDLDTLEKIVRDTLLLARLRCVDGEDLRGLGQLLPALFLPSNPRGDTIDAPVHRLLAVEQVTPGP